MKKQNFKKLITLLYVLILSFICIAPSNVYANDNGQDIINELKNVDLNIYENAGKTDVITLAEDDFGTSNYSLTLYVYNASKTELSRFTGSNVISLAYKFDSDNKPLEYSNFKLKYISSLEDNSIYKFAVLDSSKILQRAFSSQNFATGKRCYNVAGVQLLSVNDVNAKDFKIAKTFIYSGEDKNVTLDVLETIELELNDVWYRTKSSSKGANYQNQVNSVYFAVPNHYFEKGFTLTGIKAEWYEYKTQPIIVLENDEKYNVLKNYVGQDIGKYNNDLKYSLTSGLSVLDGSYIWYDYGYNVDTTFNALGTTFQVYNHLTTLQYLFSTNGASYKDFDIESKVLKDYIYNYDASNVKGYLDIKNGQVSADLFTSDVDDGRIKGYNVKTISVDDTFDLLDYNDSHTWWNSVIDYGFFDTLFGNVPSEETRKNLSPIHIVDVNEDLKDLSKVGENLLIDERFVNDFYTYVNDNLNDEEPKTTCLFRFANTDYFSQELDSKDGYLAQETIFLDFDVIQLDFAKDDVKIVVPVVSNPIDIVADVTPPVTYESWLKYAILGISLSIAGLGIYNLFKRGN